MRDMDTSNSELALLAPIEDEQWPAGIAHLRSGFAGRLNVYRVMAHNPALLAAWESLRNHVVVASALSEQQKEIVILRAGHNWHSAYEWAHHVFRGRKCGLSEERIQSARLTPDRWQDDEDAALMKAVDALLHDGQLSESQLHDLAKRIGTKGVIDLMATVGMYTTLAFLVKTFRTPIEPEIAEALAS